VAAFVAGYVLNLYWYALYKMPMLPYIVRVYCGMQRDRKDLSASACGTRFRAIARAAQRALRRAKEA